MFVPPQESFDAVKELISRSTFKEVRRVLENRLDALLSVTAGAFLQDYINAHQKVGNTQEARFLQTYAQLLQDVERDGLTTAWQHFEVCLNPVTSHLKLIEARLYFLQSDEPDDTYLYLSTWQHMLLTKDTIAWIQEYVKLQKEHDDQTMPEDDPFASMQDLADILEELRHPKARRMEQLLHLLEDAYTRGIVPAWTQYCKVLQQAESDREAEFPEEISKFWTAFDWQLDIPKRLFVDFMGLPSADIPPKDPQVLLKHAQRLRRPFDISYKIYLLSQALQLVERDKDPHLWADILYARGLAFETSPTGDTTQNKEFAIADYEAALLVEDRLFSKTALLGQYATTYANRHIGNKQKNLEIAVSRMNEALTLISQEDDPTNWVRAIINRGTIYHDLQATNPEESTELAIADYNTALAVLTPHPYAFQWARTKLNRGTAYAERMRGDPRQNWQQALADYDAALTVYPRNSVGWALTHQSRGAVLTFFKERDKLEEALAEFDMALSFSTRDSYPFDHVTLLLERAHTFMKLHRWQEAHKDYSTAREIQREVLSGVMSEASRIETIVLRAKRDMYLREVETLLHLDAPDISAQMAVILEEGRAQSMRVALDLDTLDLENTHPSPEAQARAKEVVTACEQWRIVQQELAAGPPSPSERKTFLETCPQKLRDAHNAFKQARDAYRKFVPTFMAPQATIEDISRSVRDPDEALVYLAAGSECGIAVAVRQTEGGKPRTEYQVLPHFTEKAIDTLLWMVDDSSLASTFIDDGGTIVFPHDDQLVGGYMLAQMKSGLQLIQRRGKSVSDALDCLPSESGLALAGRQLARNWSDSPISLGLLDTPFVNLTDSDLEILGRALSQALLSVELTRSLRALGELGFNKVAEWLQEQRICKVRLVPYGRLGLFPLPAVLATRQVDQERKEQPLGDFFEVTVIPNAHALEIAKQRVVAAEPHRQQILAVGNPDLEFARAEAENTERTADLFGTGPVCRMTGSDATRKNVIEGLKAAWLAHLATHGQYDQDVPRQSRLILAGAGDNSEAEQMITLEECLTGGKISLVGMRLLILSACETFITDVRRAPNEVIGIAAGFLQAGTASVIASQWKVDDLATYLLMSRFMQLYLDPEYKGWTPARCLSRAQHWLREEATYQVLATYDPMPSSEEAGSLERIQLNSAREEALKFIREISEKPAETAPTGLPYADPVYWAAFTVVGC